jgi:endonuclease/exonuclease/phosphatase (EEP) superfamily protein YafD
MQPSFKDTPTAALPRRGAAPRLLSLLASPWRRRPAPRRWRRLRFALAVLCWLYTAAVITVAIVLHYQGDRWWPATMVLFGPRWLVALPLILLVPIAPFARWRSVSGLLVAIAVVLFPVMHFQVPVQRILPHKPGPTLRILTCNTHGRELDGVALGRFIEETHPDIVNLQEWNNLNTRKVFTGKDWHLAGEGELLLASRFNIRRVQTIGGSRWGWNGAATRFEVDAPTGTLSLVNVHLESPHQAFLKALHRSPETEAQITRNSQQRLRQATDLANAAQAVGGGIILAGDFNMPADSTIYQQTLAPLNNAFSISGLGFGWSYYVKLTVTRIDHILTGDSWRPIKSWTGPPVGSPHRPLVADLEWIPPHAE